MIGTKSRRTLRAHRDDVGRRAFLRTSGRTLAGVAGVLAAGRAPASWAARELNLLTAVNYAPTSDAKLAELAKRYTKLSGVTVLGAGAPDRGQYHWSFYYGGQYADLFELQAASYR